MRNNHVVPWGSRATGFGVLACLVAVAGCGKGSGAGYPVSGKITYRGAPMVAGGSVRFVPLSVEGGKEAGGVIEKDGTYKLNTNVVPGNYRVEVYQNTVLEPTVFGPGEEEDRPIVSKEVPLPADKKISDVYKGENSPLKVTIEEKDNDIPLELKQIGGRRPRARQESGP
jgi:hypothetical protein